MMFRYGTHDMGSGLSYIQIEQAILDQQITH